MCYAEQWPKEFSLGITLYWNLQLQALHPHRHRDALESILHSRGAHHPQGEQHRSFHSVHLCHGTRSHLAVAASQGDINLSTHRPVLLTRQQSDLGLLHKPLAYQIFSASSSYRNACVAVGSSWSCPAILPLTWPGFHLTARQQILMQTSFLSDSRNGQQLFSCTLTMALMARKGEPALEGILGVSQRPTEGSPHLQGMRWCTLFYHVSSNTLYFK